MSRKNVRLMFAVLQLTCLVILPFWQISLPLFVKPPSPQCGLIQRRFDKTDGSVTGSDLKYHILHVFSCVQTAGLSGTMKLTSNQRVQSITKWDSITPKMFSHLSQAVNTSIVSYVFIIIEVWPNVEFNFVAVWYKFLLQIMMVNNYSELWPSLSTTPSICFLWFATCLFFPQVCNLCQSFVPQPVSHISPWKTGHK